MVTFLPEKKPWDLKLKMICFMGKIMVKHVLNHMAFCVLHTDKATKGLSVDTILGRVY